MRWNVERAIVGCIGGAMVEAHFNVTKAAELTGMSRGAIYRYLNTREELKPFYKRKYKITKEKIDKVIDEHRSVLESGLR